MFCIIIGFHFNSDPHAQGNFGPFQICYDYGISVCGGYPGGFQTRGMYINILSIRSIKGICLVIKFSKNGTTTHLYLFISEFIKVAGACSLLVVFSLSGLAFFSILHVAMQLQRRHICVSYVRAVFLKVIFSSIAG